MRDYLDPLINNPMTINEVREKIPGAFEIYEDGKEGNDCFDDGFVHINKGQFRISFDVGEDVRNEDVQVRKYRKLVDSVL